MEQQPSWEAMRSSASQEIPHILWNPEVHYRIHKSRPCVFIRTRILHLNVKFWYKIYYRNIALPESFLKGK
jgi:hypothetical protein